MSDLNKTKYEFNAEISKLMRIIIHNFYSSKDIFLRELISNSSDAIDKARFNSLDSLFVPKIKIYPNSDNNTLIIEDNGIGMNKEEVINCLGTIAKSGTEEFIKNVLQSQNSKKESNNIDLIGQFGVGFYSAFLVADNVQVYTKSINSLDNEVILWESNSKEGYLVSVIEDEKFQHGTKIILYLNSEQLEFLEENKLNDIIKKHSGFISYPIYLLKKQKIQKESDNKSMDQKDLDNSDEKDIDEEIDMDSIDTRINRYTNEDKKDESDTDTKDTDTKEEVNKEDTKEEVTKEEVTKEEVTKEEYTYEFVEINSKPIWTKDPKEVTEEEYLSLYKSLSPNNVDFEAYKHFKAEGDIEFSAILFIPKNAPFDMFDNKKINNNMKLYVKKVLITDNCKDLFPEYFNFIYGIVDSQDLPLNASRELLQQSKIIKKINKILVKKTIEMFNELSLKTDSYKSFYDNYHKNIKLAIHEDTNNKIKLLNLLRYQSNKRDNIGFQDYIDNMKENQQGVYYIIGNNIENVKNSAFIEKLVKNNFEVLLMYDPLDEYIMQQINEFDNKKFINVIKDDIKLDDTEDTKKDEDNEICKKIKEILGSTVSNVVVSSKLESHPVIVTNKMGWSANMERIVKAQALGNNNMMNFMMDQKTMEINLKHKLIEKLIELDYDKNFINLLYNMGLLAGGYELPNTNNFLEKLYECL